MPAIANDTPTSRDLFFMRLPFLIGFLAGSLFGATGASSAFAEPTFDKAMIVMLENATYEEAASQPFLSSLAARGAILTNLIAETHPSQPNYLALVAGSTFGVTSDANVDLDASHLGDLLESKSLLWKAYVEGYPGHCFLGERSGLYVRKHVPFLTFKNIQENQTRCARVVDAGELAADVANGKLPTFSLYIPDLDDDGHDTGVAHADQWLAKTFGPLLSEPQFMKGMLFIVTFDEDRHLPFFQSRNRVFTALVGDSVIPSSTSAMPYNHYSILRTIEASLGLGSLSHEDATAPPISGVWNLGTRYGYDHL